MIKADNLSFRYSWRKQLFEQLSFEVKPGSITGLLGLNGEGKTSLLKLIAGQLLYQQGTMEVLGHDPKRRQVDFLSSIFYLPESFRFPRNATAVEYFDLLKHFYPTYNETTAAEALSAFGVDRSMKIRRGSQGEQKKVLISFALALDVPVLLMDEPTNGLDIPSKSIFRKLLAKHSHEERTIIISTHQVRDLEQLIDQVMVLQKNKIITHHSIAQLSERFIVAPVGAREDAIYQEMSTHGQVGLFTKAEGEDYNFSIELFFNALMAEQERIISILNS